MYRLRRLALRHNVIAALMVAIVLAMKALIPTGYMPTTSDGRIVVSICSGTGPATMVMAMPGMEHGDTDEGKHDGKHQPPCAFSGLSAPLLAAADPVLLAAAILFVLALGIRIASVLPAATPGHLRPPLRGPPATA